MNLYRPFLIGLSIVALGLAGAILFSPLEGRGQAPAPEAVGAEKCKLCHRTKAQGSQFSLWEASAHARSVAGLKTEKALTIAKESCLTEAPEVDPKCLKCHAPLAGRAEPGIAAEGVTCEACHGPGSLYKKLTVMMSREKCVLNGLVVYPDTETIKTSCLACHAHAHGVAFDFDAAWKLIRHDRPGK